MSSILFLFLIAWINIFLINIPARLFPNSEFIVRSTFAMLCCMRFYVKHNRTIIVWRTCFIPNELRIEAIWSRYQRFYQVYFQTSTGIFTHLLDTQSRRPSFPARDSKYTLISFPDPWWRHQMETFSALLALCVGNSPVTGEFSAQRSVTRSFDVFVYLRLNKRLSNQPRSRWFQTPLGSLWRHCDAGLALGPILQKVSGLIIHIF